MKTFTFRTIWVCGLAMAASVALADQTTSTVTYIAPVDVQSCIMAPVLLNSHTADSTALTRGEAEALVHALGAVRAVAAGSVELTVFRHGNNGSVKQAVFAGAMGNSYVAAFSVSADASGETSANATAGTDAYVIASTAAGVDWDVTPLNINLGKRIGGDEVNAGAEFVAAAGVRGSAEGSGYASGGAVGEAVSGGTSRANVSAATSNDASAKIDATTFVVVDAANITRFEGNMSMSGAVLHTMNSSAIAEVLADAYARAYADAFAQSHAASSAGAELFARLYARLYAHLVDTYDVTLINWNPSWPIGQYYDSASAEDRETLAAEFRPLVEAQAEAIVDALASARLDVNLGVRFENRRGTVDLLEATGNTSVTLTCDMAQSLASAAAAD